MVFINIIHSEEEEDTLNFDNVVNIRRIQDRICFETVDGQTITFRTADNDTAWQKYNEVTNELSNGVKIIKLE